VRFSRAYTCCPLCGPARRSMLNGLYPHSHGEIKNDSYAPFLEEDYLIKLAKQEYHNYYYGKWHAGPGNAHDHACEGFSYTSYGNPYITREYQEYLQEQHLPPFEVEIVQSFQKNLEKGSYYKPLQSMYTESMAGIMTTPKETHESYFLAHLACEKLEQIARINENKPFHLRVDFWGPHQPYLPAREFYDMYDPKAIPKHPNFDDDLSDKPEIYKYEHHYPISKDLKIIHPNPVPWSTWQEVLACNYAEQTMLDTAAGMIIKRLEELGLAENTFIIWTTDHGDGLACHGGHFDKNAYMPEEMVRIPMAIKYPGVIEKGQTRDELVNVIDFAPTFLDLAGTSFSQPVTGKSMLPLLRGANNDWREDVMCETFGHHSSHLGRLVVHDHYKYVYNEGDMDELYDLSRDPYELINLINDKNSSKLLSDMKSRLKKWREMTNDTVTQDMIGRKRLKPSKS